MLCFRGIRPIQRMHISVHSLPLTAQDFRVDMDPDCLEQFTFALNSLSITPSPLPSDLPPSTKTSPPSPPSSPSPSTPTASGDKKTLTLTTPTTLTRITLSSIQPEDSCSLSSSLLSPLPSPTSPSSGSSSLSFSLKNKDSRQLFFMTPTKKRMIKDEQGAGGGSGSGGLEEGLSKPMVHEIIASALERMATFEPLIPKLLDDIGFQLLSSLAHCPCCIKYTTAAFSNLCQSLYGMRTTHSSLISHRNIEKFFSVLIPSFLQNLIPLLAESSSSSPSSSSSCCAFLSAILSLLKLNKGKQILSQTNFLPFVMGCTLRSQGEDSENPDSPTVRSPTSVSSMLAASSPSRHPEPPIPSSLLRISERFLAIDILCEFVRCSDLELRSSFLSSSPSSQPAGEKEQQPQKTSSLPLPSPPPSTNLSHSSLVPCLLSILNNSQKKEEQELRIKIILGLQNLYLTDSKKFDFIVQMHDREKHRCWRQILIQSVDGIEDSSLRVDVMQQIMESVDEDEGEAEGVEDG